jgi:hypothetical protein
MMASCPATPGMPDSAVVIARFLNPWLVFRLAGTT